MAALLSRGPLSLDRAYAAVRSPERGAVLLFLGTVRASEAGRPISAIEYEAYEAMALRELEKAAALAAARHGAAVHAVHRLGPVPAGEPSVIVAAAAAHRAEAFAACRDVIEALKAAVPIWKTDFLPAAAEAR